MKQPSVGAIVHYQPEIGWSGPEGPIAAMVTAVQSNGVKLSSFLPGFPPGYLSNGPHGGAPAAVIPFAESPTPGRWNWPPEVEDVKELVVAYEAFRDEALQRDAPHLSDCALHNEPAMRSMPCDCVGRQAR